MIDKNNPLMLGVAVGMAGVNTSLHTLRIMANRGVASPDDVEDVYSSIIGHLEEWTPKEVTAMVTANMDSLMVKIREAARANWKG